MEMISKCYGTNYPSDLKLQYQSQAVFFSFFTEPPQIWVHLLFWAEPVGALSPRPALGRLKDCWKFCWEIVSKTEIHQSHWGTGQTELWQTYRPLKITCVNVKTSVIYIMASALNLWGCQCLTSQFDDSPLLPSTFWSFSCSQLVTGWTVAAGNFLIKQSPHLDVCLVVMEEFSCCCTLTRILYGPDGEVKTCQYNTTKSYNYKNRMLSHLWPQEQRDQKTFGHYSHEMAKLYFIQSSGLSPKSLWTVDYTNSRRHFQFYSMT